MYDELPPMYDELLPMHDGLQDGGEGSDPDAGADEECVLGVEDLTRRRAKRAVNVDVERRVDLLDIQLLPLHTARPEQNNIVTHAARPEHKTPTDI